ncbi:abortive infection system antitoxin AbiGi family protein [Arcobacter lacus]|uniref:abortive infection system antitoxin AbiGi family protein n=1 Tax=Arcobacter lacus TaxID=1912876 RepID=UPI0021BB40E0|nr:abortive infection system antitoxin AbiGi family protein [Arcobacter lacus]MCT7911360.1 abortive infection system antitoxin AbiGi family protein [Arcobacter lacus]
MLNHFTKELNTLISILKDSSFRLSYCSEEFRDENEKIISHAAHPMVCFSEYNEKEIASKNITYGCYCISMKKDWAIKNKLNPVLYVEKNSHIALGLKTLLLRRKKTQKGSSFPRLAVMQIKCFTKHVKGYNSHFDEDNFDFKYENEWRYVPEKKDIGNYYISIDNSRYKQVLEKAKKNLIKDKYNKRLESFPLKFNENDIEFVFVEEESEIRILEQSFPFLNGKVRKYTWKYTPKK